jgi:hypothetical protein
MLDPYAHLDIFLCAFSLFCREFLACYHVEGYQIRTLVDLVGKVVSASELNTV